MVARVVRECKHCGEWKDQDELVPRASIACGFRPLCRVCSSKQRAEWFQRNEDRIREYKREYALRNRDKTKDAALSRVYGITLAEYNYMLQEQHGGCKICGHAPADGKRALAVDHDHSSGNVRALLCSPCNIGLGAFKDNRGILGEAIKYLRSYEDG